jgi:sporulation protein YlmC with PRC-barrel domain
MSERSYFAAQELLDHQIVDSQTRHCGRVDDLEIAGGPGEPAVITAILVGPGAWRERIRGSLRRLVSRLFGGNVVRVPWERVDEIAAFIKLDDDAKALGLGTGNDRAARWVARIPGS